MNRRLVTLPIAAALLLGACGSGGESADSVVTSDDPDPYQSFSVDDGNCTKTPPVQQEKTDESLVYLPNCDSTFSAERLDPAQIDDLVRQIGCWEQTAEKDPAKCSYHGLAAIEVKPDGWQAAGVDADVYFDLSPYDAVNSAECLRLAKSAPNRLCDEKILGGEETLKFKIFRVVTANGAPTAWDESGDAQIDDSAEVAEGTLDHNSTHVLVALPDPTGWLFADGESTAPVLYDVASADNGDSIEFSAAFDLVDGGAYMLSEGGALELLARLRFVSLVEVGDECADDSLSVFETFECQLGGVDRVVVSVSPVGAVFSRGEREVLVGFGLAEIFAG